MAASTADVVFAGQQVSWLVPVFGLSVIAAALAYFGSRAQAEEYDYQAVPRPSDTPDRHRWRDRPDDFEDDIRGSAAALLPDLHGGMFA